MTKPKRDRYCMWCRKSMLRHVRIEMGHSVMTGAIAVCSKRCQDAYNSKGESLQAEVKP